MAKASPDVFGEEKAENHRGQHARLGIPVDAEVGLMTIGWRRGGPPLGFASAEYKITGQYTLAVHSNSGLHNKSDDLY